MRAAPLGIFKRLIVVARKAHARGNGAARIVFADTAERFFLAQKEKPARYGIIALFIAGGFQNFGKVGRISDLGIGKLVFVARRLDEQFFAL